MAKTKADLIEEATAAGIPLTGNETGADLRALLKDTDAQDGETAAPVEIPATEVAVSETAKAVADAKVVLDKAAADHEEAKVAHAAATAPPKPVPGTHLLIEGSESPVLIPGVAVEGALQRRVLINGVNYEHVSDRVVTDEAGAVVGTVWVYRRM